MTDLDKLLTDLHAAPSALELAAVEAIASDAEPMPSAYADAAAELAAFASSMNDELAAGCSQERAQELVQQMQEKRRALAALAIPTE